MEEEPAIDRRSARTRQLLHSALLALMLEKRYDKITVQDIIDRADVGRSTFYAHYRDKEDLLVTNFERMLELFSDHWVAHAKDLGPESTGEATMSVAALFDHAQEFHDLYKALVWGKGIELIHQQAQQFFSQRVEALLRANILPGTTSTVPLPLLANHIAATLGALLRWWLEAEMPHTPAEMDHYFHQLITPVLVQAFGQR